MIQSTEILRSGLIYTEKKSPHFEFWYTLPELPCLMVMFVCSVRKVNFELFAEVDHFSP